MSTLNPSSPTLGAPLTTPVPRASSAEAPALSAAPDVVRTARDGLVWTCRPGAEALLARVPASAWSDPASQGWQRVKINARREVWRAVIDGAPHYLKYHYRESWIRRLRHLFRDEACRAEWDGGLYAWRADIAATRPVAHTLSVRRGTRRCALLITEAVEPAQPLSDFWLQLQSDTDVVRRRRDAAQVCELLAEMIARAHQAGFEHLDMHAANILVQPLAPRRYRTVFIDLQSARRGAPLSDAAVVRNLAQLNQWFRTHSSAGDRLRFLRAYLRWRNEFETLLAHGRPLDLRFEQLVAALRAAAHRHAARLWAQRDRRCARDGRYFMRLRLPGGWRGLAVRSCKHATGESRASHLEFERKWWHGQLQAPLRWFDAPGTQSCKESHSGFVRRTILEHDRENVPVILKRPRARSWRRVLAQLWPPSRSARGWQTGHALLNRDLPTARPLALLERWRGPLVLDSVLVTEAIPGAVDLESFLKREFPARAARDWCDLKRVLGLLLAQQLRRLVERGFEHRDCKASNILVVPQPRLALLWIDMDGLRRRGSRRPPAPRRALVRLHVSLRNVAGLTRTDRVRFLRAYFAGYGVGGDEWREVWKRLSADVVAKSRAKEARRAWKLQHYGRE